MRAVLDRCLVRCLPIALGVLLLAADARAERVVFRDLRVLDVVSAVREGDVFVLDFGEGKTMSVAAIQVLEIRPDPEPAASEEPASTWRRIAGDLADSIEDIAARHGLDPELILAVALVESGLDPHAVSPKGAIGLMQLMPATADELEVDDPHDPEQNLEAGARWLRRMLDLFEGDLWLALAAYNAGENAVRRHGGIPPYTETLDYVERVQDRLDRLLS